LLTFSTFSSKLRSEGSEEGFDTIVVLREGGVSFGFGFNVGLFGEGRFSTFLARYANFRVLKV
jgi:hypothetical protein